MHPFANRITPQFNFNVFCFGAIVGIIKFLLTSPKANAPLMGLVISICLDAALHLACLFILALIIREFWNRLICDVFSLRPIAYVEAIGIVLVASLFGLAG